MVATEIEGDAVVVQSLLTEEFSNVVFSIDPGQSKADFIAVFMHDLKGGGDNVSAMINGKRLFEVKPIPEQEISGVHTVSLDRLNSGLKKPAVPDCRKNDQDG